MPEQVKFRIFGTLWPWWGRGAVLQLDVPHRSYAVLDTPTKHVFIQAVEDQRSKRLLQIIVLSCVDANYRWLLVFP